MSEQPPAGIPASGVAPASVSGVVPASGTALASGTGRGGSPDPGLAISATGITKSYGGNTGLFDVDLSVRTGSVTALLGPNGAGKTTAVRILSTLLRPDRGEVRVGGRDALRRPREVQSLIGLAGQSVSVDAKLSGAENLALFGRLQRLPRRTIRSRSARLMEQFGLADAAKKPVQSYSGGMRRKLDLAVSLIGEPSILFLDEPTTGLDPASRAALWGIIRSLVAEGATVLLTTQYLDEADALAEAIVFIDAGRVVAEGTPAQLKARVGQSRLRIVLHSNADAEAARAALGAFAATADGATVQVMLPAGGREGGLRSLGRVIEAIEATGVAVADYEVREPGLDDVYFQLTGHLRAGVEAGGDAPEEGTRR